MTSFLRRIGLLAGAIVLAAGLLVATQPASQAIGPDLDLSRFTLVFADEFDALDVSAAGPGTRWIAHTPWHGDFGDARFSDPGPFGPFDVKDGILSITARKDATGRWRSGLLSSVDGRGQGFAQQYGYFEIRAQLPAGEGEWPAFWLNTVKPPGWTAPTVEFDIFEQYGRFPGDFHTVVHIWPNSIPGRSPQAVQTITKVEPGSLYTDFHTYGMDVEPDWTTLYFDGRMQWRCPTPSEHKNKLMILVNLALGSGWPIDQTPNPSVMEVDYIRAYARKAH